MDDYHINHPDKTVL